MAKKILMVLSSVSIGGGVQGKVMDLYRRMDKTKVQVDFLVHSMSTSNNFSSEIKSMGGKLFYWGRLKKVGLFSYVKNLFSLIKKEKYDIVHSYMGVNDGLILLLARIAKSPIRISHVRTITNKSSKRKLLKPLLKYSIKKNSTHLLASSTIAGKSLYGNEKFEVIPNPFETERFLNKNSETVHEIKKELEISENMLVLGHVGRFSQEKNHEFLLELAWNLREQSHLFKIILVGDGELRQHINEKIEKMDLRNVFHITGAQSNIEDFYHLFDILLFPSLHEGFGNVAVEAQIAKKYVIASDGVSSETDLGLGLIDFISINNMDTWIELITNYNRGMATDISDEKVRRVLKEGNYDIKRNIEKYYSIYKL